MTSKSDIEKAMSDQAEADAAESVTDSWKPQCVYLYLLTNPRDGHHANIRAYLEDWRQDIDEGNVESVVADMLERIAANTLRPIASRFRDVVWTRRSYVVVLLDDERFTLSKDDFELRLKLRPAGYTHARHTISGEENMTPMGNITGVRMLNKVAKKNGSWPHEPPETERFKVNMEFRARPQFSDLEPLGHDDSATNLGPPPQP